MNIMHIKEKMDDLCGRTFNFRYNGARNQKEEFVAKLVKTYPSVFTVQLQNDNCMIKSFSYNDVLIETLEISNFKIK